MKVVLAHAPDCDCGSEHVPAPDGGASGPRFDDLSDGSLPGLAITPTAGGVGVTHIASGRLVFPSDGWPSFTGTRLAQFALDVCRRELPACDWTRPMADIKDDPVAKQWHDRLAGLSRRPVSGLPTAPPRTRARGHLA